jgi:hypothetical protein
MLVVFVTDARPHAGAAQSRRHGARGGAGRTVSRSVASGEQQRLRKPFEDAVRRHGRKAPLPRPASAAGTGGSAGARAARLIAGGFVRAANELRACGLAPAAAAGTWSAARGGGGSMFRTTATCGSSTLRCTRREGGEEGYGRGTRMGNGREGGEGRAPSPARARRERGGRHGGAGAPREARFVPRRVHWQRTSALSICRTTIVPGSPASASATSQWSRSSCSCAARRLNNSDPTFRNGTRVSPPPSRTKWTRLVSPLVLSGHVSSLLPY